MSNCVDEDLWFSTFQNVKVQALRAVDVAVFDTASGGWVDLGTDQGRDWSDDWPPQQWAIAFEIILCRSPLALHATIFREDDLLLFVYLPDSIEYKGTPVFARRRKDALPPDLTWGSALAPKLDWRASLLLNIVLQTPYRLTVARCQPWELDCILEKVNTSPQQSMPILGPRSSVVIKKVHASPMETPVMLTPRRTELTEPRWSYPNICFAVEDHLEAFESLTLEEATDCYVVVLHADVDSAWGAALSQCRRSSVEEVYNRVRDQSGQLQNKSSSGTSLSKAFQGLSMSGPSALENDAAGDTSLIVFNGFVNKEQVSRVLGHRLSGWRAGHGTTRSGIRLVLKGPQGMGKVETAVSVVPRDTATSEEERMTDAPAAVKRVAGAASSLMTKALAGARNVVSSGRGREAEQLGKIRCSLMTIVLPVDFLASEILKGCV